MKVRFQADADLNQVIVKATLRLEPSIDFQTALAADFAGLGDSAVLGVAAQQDRILVTHDRKTMPHHFGTFVQKEKSPGVLIVSQRMPVSQVAEELFLIWLVSEPEDWSTGFAHYLYSHIVTQKLTLAGYGAITAASPPSSPPACAKFHYSRSNIP